MAKRLVKIAKELNVGTSTIVEYLDSQGHSIENKPTAKVSDEMYADLIKQFSNSIAEKEKADKLIIGNRLPKQEVPVVKPPVKVVIPEPVAPPPAPVVPEPEPVKEAAVEPVVEEVKVAEPVITPEPKEEVREEPTRPGLKVLGKIDLSKPKKKSKPAPEPKKQEPAKPKEEKKVEKIVPEKKVEKPVEKVIEAKKDKEKNPSQPEEMVRAKTPRLAGLKILGKIDTKKLEEKKSTKKDDKSTSNDPSKRRKRTRKKVTASNMRRGGASDRNKGRGKKDDEVKEVSKKEIEERLKQTMARISGGGGKKRRQKIRRENRDDKREKQEALEVSTETGKIQVTEFISVSELASIMEVDVTDVIMTCMNLGVIVSINQRLDAEIIELLGDEFGKEVEFISSQDESEDEEEIIDAPEDLLPRAPIVTVMGHVDHGKTSLLDYIRSASVADGEAGGITQHIGAYEVNVKGNKITFLDTPGHEAFTAMRARGAKVTDIAVVIISADDRIMPQTKEAISHAQAAGVPIVFAINKIDKDGARPEKIKEELATMNLLVEDWGGSIQSQDISAKTGLNIDLLLEKIVLEAEVLELKANPQRAALGTVIEASLDKGRGYVTKLLVQNGTLKIGDPVYAGSHSGKIKAMFNESGQRVKEAGPSAPVLVLGLSGAPQAGERFKVTETEQESRQIATRKQQIAREQTNRASKRISLDEIGRRLVLGTFKELNLIVKGDVDGSVEALADSLIKLSLESVQVNVIHKAVGQIVESDILLASASDAIVIGFQVRPSTGARNLAEKEGVQIKTYSIIYEAIDEIKLAIEGMLEPTKEEKIVAQVEIRETYKISKIGTIAGCYVQEGKISRNSHIRLIRDGIVVYPIKEGAHGALSSLKRFKDDVKEVKNGMECGLNIKNFNDLRIGDMIEAYEIHEVKQTYE